MWNAVAFVLKHGATLSPTETDDIKRILVRHGLNRQQEDIYWGNLSELGAEAVVKAAQDVFKQVPGIGDSVQAVQMMHIEDENSLKPVIKRTLKQRKSS